MERARQLLAEAGYQPQLLHRQDSPTRTNVVVRVPGADHLLDPCNGRRLYTRDCRELLARVAGPGAELKIGRAHV